jgi:RNA polymerase sigma factor (sigma-70 family)
LTLQDAILGCKEKNTKHQEQLFRLLSGKLFGICLKYSRNYAEAQDNLQDGFLIIFEKINQYKNTGAFEAWAKRIMINNALQQYRNTTFLEIVNDIPDENTFDLEDESVSLTYLLQIIQELPDKYRMVFNLFVLDEYSHTEIAELLGITVGTSKSNLSRAKQILKHKIESSQVEIVPNVK